MFPLFTILKIFSGTFAVGALIQALMLHLAAYKPRDHRYARFMLGSFVMFCLGLGSWFMAKLVEATYIEMLARGAV